MRPPVQDSAVTTRRPAHFARPSAPTAQLNKLAIDLNEIQLVCGDILPSSFQVPCLFDRRSRRVSGSAARAAASLFQASPARLGGAGPLAFASWQLRAESPGPRAATKFEKYFSVKLPLPALFGNSLLAPAPRGRRPALWKL